MGKKSGKIKVPKKIMGFKLSKGTRKDIRKLLRMIGSPDKRQVAMTAAGGLAAYLTERFAAHELEKHHTPQQAH
jgi:hypothetical protein